MLSEKAINAFNDIYTLQKEINSGAKKESALNELFSRLSKINFYDKYESKVKMYIAAFKYFNSRYGKESDNIKDIMMGNLCGAFVSEHFKHVQQPFWNEYKEVYKKDSSLISPALILKKVKEVESK
jgi:hypothetical protein